MHVNVYHVGTSMMMRIFAIQDDDGNYHLVLYLVFADTFCFYMFVTCFTCPFCLLVVFLFSAPVKILQMPAALSPQLHSCSCFVY